MKNALMPLTVDCQRLLTPWLRTARVPVKRVLGAHGVLAWMLVCLSCQSSRGDLVFDDERFNPSGTPSSVNALRVPPAAEPGSDGDPPNAAPPAEVTEPVTVEPMAMGDAGPGAVPGGSQAAEPQPAAPRDCEPGQFRQQGAAGEPQCAPCSSGYYSTQVNAEACVQWTDCSAGEFVALVPSAWRDRGCETCASGTFSSQPNVSQCTAVGECEAGSVQTAPASGAAPAQCEACTAGEFCLGGDAPKMGCADGTWDDDANPATECVPHTECVAGQFVEQAGSAVADRLCVACGAETFSTQSNAVGCSALKTCPAGTRVLTEPSASTNRECAPCEAGTFSSALNATRCTSWRRCSAGTWVSMEPSVQGDRECTPCAAETFSTTTNAGRCTAWRTCPAGTWVTMEPSAETNRECAECAPGTITESPNLSRCSSPMDCPGGTEQVAPATASAPAECVACEPGDFCPGGETAKTSCAAGTWDHDSNPASSCRVCTSGFFCAGGAAEPQEWAVCSPGQEQRREPSSTQNRTCASCAAGSYSTSNNATDCDLHTSCSAGSVQVRAGAASRDVECEACSRGQYCAGAEEPAVACTGNFEDHDNNPATACERIIDCAPDDPPRCDGDSTVVTCSSQSRFVRSDCGDDAECQAGSCESTVASLASLSLSHGDLTFNSRTTSYVVTLPVWRTEIEMTATAQGEGAITINGVAVRSGVPERITGIAARTNVPVVVTSPAGTTREYLVSLRRKVNPVTLDFRAYSIDLEGDTLVGWDIGPALPSWRLQDDQWVRSDITITNPYGNFERAFLNDGFVAMHDLSKESVTVYSQSGSRWNQVGPTIPWSNQVWGAAEVSGTTVLIVRNSVLEVLTLQGDRWVPVGEPLPGHFSARWNGAEEFITCTSDGSVVFDWNGTTHSVQQAGPGTECGSAFTSSLMATTPDDRVQVYERNLSGWSLQQTLGGRQEHIRDLEMTDEVVVLSRSNNQDLTSTGEVDYYVRDGDDWDGPFELPIANPTYTYGSEVAVDADTVVVADYSTETIYVW